MSELGRLDGNIKEVRTKLAATHDDVLTLKVQASAWGAVAGAVTTVIVLLISLL